MGDAPNNTNQNTNAAGQADNQVNSNVGQRPAPQSVQSQQPVQPNQPVQSPQSVQPNQQPAQQQPQAHYGNGQEVPNNNQVRHQPPQPPQEVPQQSQQPNQQQWQQYSQQQIQPQQQGRNGNQNPFGHNTNQDAPLSSGQKVMWFVMGFLLDIFSIPLVFIIYAGRSRKQRGEALTWAVTGLCVVMVVYLLVFTLVDPSILQQSAMGGFGSSQGDSGSNWSSSTF